MKIKRKNKIESTVNDLDNKASKNVVHHGLKHSEAVSHAKEHY